MSDKKKILVVEDEITNAVLFKRLLQKSNYDVKVAYNGKEALEIYRKEEFDSILTDWMMPKMDGIALIEMIRQEKDRVPPFIIMITALASENARDQAIRSGADDFIAKPVDVKDLLSRIDDGLNKYHQELDEVIITKKSTIGLKPKFPCVAIATSTGGPPVLTKLFKNLTNPKAAYLVVQHGPPWMLETFVQRLQRETSLKVKLGVDNEYIQPGHIYLAPGDYHMTINPKRFKLMLDDGPKQNFVRPAADPMFQSASEGFGEYLIGVVLTGLGKDGAIGAAQIKALNGFLFVQDPSECIAPSMPQSVISIGIDHKLSKIDTMPKRINDKIDELASKLNN